MSAWIVSKAHIDVLVYGLITFELLNEEKADTCGQMLVDECVKSVSALYPRDTPEDLPGPADNYYLKPYRFERPTKDLISIAIAKAVACFKYQSCEHDEWETSNAKKVMDILEVTIAERYPNYENSEEYEYGSPWGFEEADIR